MQVLHLKNRSKLTDFSILPVLHLILPIAEPTRIWGLVPRSTSSQRSGQPGRMLWRRPPHSTNQFPMSDQRNKLSNDHHLDGARESSWFSCLYFLFSRPPIPREFHLMTIVGRRKQTMSELHYNFCCMLPALHHQSFGPWLFDSTNL